MQGLRVTQGDADAINVLLPANTQVSPALCKDGNLYLGADLLQEIGPGGLYAAAASLIGGLTPAEVFTAAEFDRALAQLEAELLRRAQERLDSFAQRRGYDNIISLCSYRDDPNPTFAREAASGITARSGTWTFLTGLRGSAGSSQTIPSADDVIAQLAQAVPLEW